MINMVTFLQYVESQPGGATSMMRSHVVPAVTGAVSRNRLPDIDAATLPVIAADMLGRGLSVATVRRYLGTLHTAWQAWHTANDVTDSDPFPALIGAVAAITPPAVERLRHNLTLLPALVARSAQPVAAAALYLLYTVDAPLDSVVRLSRDRYPTGCPQLDELHELSAARPQARYVFPLGQGRQRDNALRHKLLGDMAALMRQLGFRLDDTFSRADITALWCAAAGAAGVTLGEQRSMLDSVPAAMGHLGLIQPSTLSDSRRTSIRNHVASSINDRTSRWFVMKLRRGCTPDDIDTALRQADPALARSISYYYPTRPVVVKTGHKRVTENRPYLHDILFFRTSRDRIPVMFRYIGDMAWCFRINGKPGSPYSSISPVQMRIFQQHIGQLTGDVELQLIAEAAPAAIGDRVLINGGSILEGTEAVVTKITASDGADIYTLRLSDSAYIHWKEFTLPATLLTPLR